jgi:hypothetical protein
VQEGEEGLRLRHVLQPLRWYPSCCSAEGARWVSE